MSRASQFGANTVCMFRQLARRKFQRAWFHVRGMFRAVFNIKAE